MVEKGLYLCRCKIEKLVRLVSNDVELVLLCKLHQFGAFLVGSGVACWIVVHGHRVHEFDLSAALGADFLERVQVHAVLQHGHPLQLQPLIAGHGESQEVSRLLEHANVTSLAMSSESKVCTHGSANRRHQRLRVHRRLVLSLQELGQALQKSGMAEHVGAIHGVSVVQGLLGHLQPLLEALGERTAQISSAEKLWVRPSFDEVLRLRGTTVFRVASHDITAIKAPRKSELCPKTPTKS
mmetsp:Transcript_28468/g.66004  ORF Transcript_28468/g.66004 Transcript_28468/m.66004 type:complete len:239 (-) Transcript_28468:7-723(-)